MDKAEVIASVCEALTRLDSLEARRIARERYPFVPGVAPIRKYTTQEQFETFRRDGFIDRYSGTRLVFPATLRILSKLLPKEFPVHPNWQMASCHSMYWELYPTLDHVVPVARGGEDGPANWVTTSMVMNSAKSGWTLEELRWSLHPAGRLEDWDGLTAWAIEYCARNAELMKEPYVASWIRVAQRDARPSAD